MTDSEHRLSCGIIMPISSIDNCPSTHWAEVKEILGSAIAAAGFHPVLVSDAEESGLIHKRIVENIYNNPIVVCDVSGKNPNVMFELGMRLTFDKPTVIVKDNATDYSFDTAGIEHLEYPRDLRFSKIVDFKAALEMKIRATYRRSQDDESFTTFLKHFGPLIAPKIEKKEVSSQEYIIEELRLLKESMLHLQLLLRNGQLNSARRFRDSSTLTNLTLCIRNNSKDKMTRIISTFENFLGKHNILIRMIADDHCHIKIRADLALSKEAILSAIDDDLLKSIRFLPSDEDILKTIE